MATIWSFWSNKCSNFMNEATFVKKIIYYTNLYTRLKIMRCVCASIKPIELLQQPWPLPPLPPLPTNKHCLWYNRDTMETAEVRETKISRSCCQFSAIRQSWLKLQRPWYWSYRVFYVDLTEPNEVKFQLVETAVLGTQVSMSEGFVI